MRATWAALLLGLMVLLAGCGSAPLTTGQAAATAVAGGCWPYGARQPLPPTPRPATATPRIQPANPQATATPTATTASSPTPWVVYPTCTPAPLTPTVTPEPTETPQPWIAPTPQPPAAITSPQELQDATGIVREFGLSWAYNPRTEAPVISWIAWGWRPDEGTDGQVWVMSQGPTGAWRQPQTVNTAPVIRNYGGAAVAAAPSGEMRLLFGSGEPDPGVDSVVSEVRSTDDGATWSLPQPITTGGVQALRADSQGGWHALVIGPQPFNAQLRYGYAPAGGSWRWHDIGPARDEYRADLALLELGGSLTRMVITTRAGTELRPGSHLHIYRSTDGLSWSRATQAPLSEAAIGAPTMRPQLLAVSRGEGLVAAVWSNFGSGLVLASISTDGGRTFGPEEIIAKNHEQALITPEHDYGIDPSVAYDPEADTLLVSWNEIETGAGEVFPVPMRSYVARRPLERPLGQPWINAITPNTVERPRPMLDPQRRTYLFATPDGQHAGLVIVDERNYQARITYRGVHLPALTTLAEN